MKLIMFLLRYLCLMALILVVVYAPDALLYGNSGAAEQLPCYEAVGRVWSQWLQGNWYQESWFLITAGVLLILAFARGVTAIWNVLYALSLILMLAAGSIFFINLPLALPSAIGSMPELQFLPTLYRTEAALVSFIPVVFLLGLLLSNARVRIFIYSVVCYVLWYGLSELFTYLLSLWQQAETPVLPELLAFLYDTRWLLVALIGAFLLVYDLILSFSETFATPPRKADAGQAGKKDSDGSAANASATAPAKATAATATPATTAASLAGKPAGSTPAAPKPAPSVKAQVSPASATASKPLTAKTGTTAPTPKAAPAPHAAPTSTSPPPKPATAPAGALKPATATMPAVITIHKTASTPQATQSQKTQTGQPSPSANASAHKATPDTQPPASAAEASPAPSAPKPTATPPPAPMPIAKPFAPTDEKLDEPDAADMSAPAERSENAGQETSVKPSPDTASVPADSTPARASEPASEPASASAAPSASATPDSSAAAPSSADK